MPKKINPGFEKIERLQVRIDSHKKNLIKRGATLLHKTLTDFIINSACENAWRVINDYEKLHLSGKLREDFIKAISDYE